MANYITTLLMIFSVTNQIALLISLGGLCLDYLRVNTLILGMAKFVLEIVCSIALIMVCSIILGGLCLGHTMVKILTLE